MTWKQFKDAVEAGGVIDEMEVWYIDVTFPSDGDISVSPQKDNSPNDIGFSVG